MGCLADVGSTCVFEAVGDCTTATGGSGTITAVVAGAGLTGGGVTGSVTLNVGAGTGITVAADSVAVDTTVIATRAYVDSAVAASGDITSVTAGAGLTGGGTSGAVTLDIGAGTGITVAADSISVDTTVIASKSYVDTADALLVPQSRTLTAGAGLTGTGDLSANRTFDVGAGTGITVAADSVAVDQTFAPTWTGAHIFSTTDAGTTTTTRKRTDQHLSSGTPAAGFGVGQSWALHSSANTSRTAAQFDYTWIAATDTSETTKASMYLRGLNGLAAGNSALPTTPTVAWSSEAGETIFITDTATATVTDLLVLDHRTSGTAAASYGTGILFRGQDASATAGGDDIARIAARWTAATSGAEYTTVAIQTRANGAALADAFSIVNAAGGGATKVFVPTATLLGLGTTSTNSFMLSIASNRGVVSTSGAASVFGITLSAAGTAATSGAHGGFLLSNTMSNTGQTLQTEISNFSVSAISRQWATGNFATQREHLFAAPTYTFVGASTITDAATVAISGAPVASTNATITNTYSFWTQGGRVRHDGITVALGGGSAPTFGTIGGSGPASAAQNCWVELTIDGTKTWLPAWR
jgi:hypothetical protein